MATKGASMRYGNTRGAHHRGEATQNINYPWAKDFLGTNSVSHFKDHGKEMGFKSEKEYVANGIHFANDIDRQHYKSVINYKGETYKYDPGSKQLVVVSKKGYIRTYYSTKGSGGFYYSPKKGTRIWIKV